MVELNRYLELQYSELVRLEDAMTRVNLAAPTRQAMILRGDFRRRVKSQRECIAIVEKAIFAAA